MRSNYSADWAQTAYRFGDGPRDGLGLGLIQIGRELDPQPTVLALYDV